MTLARRVFRSLILPLKDFVYPPVCLTCSSLLKENEALVCAACWMSFRRASPSEGTWMRIRDRFDSEGHVADFLTCFVFEKEGGIKDVIHHLKYKNIRSIGERLGHEAGRLIMASPSFSDADYLLPVPLHKLTLRERGYNQSEHISSGISEITHIPKVTSFLAREKYTRSQTKLDPVERNRNVEGAFEVPEGSRQFVKGKKLILVDDVITTGSTLSACAAELKRNGALRVLVVSAAIAGQRLS